MSVLSALLVIDVQESFLHADYWNPAGFEQYQRKQNTLIDNLRQQGVPVVHVYHIDPTGPFSLATGWVRPMQFVSRTDADQVFHKHVHNALTESGLEQWLKNQGISKVIISGIRTEQCCETTARVASDLGYEVEFVSDATLSFPMQHPVSKRLYSVEEIREHTEMVLEGRFATIKSVADYVQ